MESKLIHAREIQQGDVIELGGDPWSVTTALVPKYRWVPLKVELTLVDTGELMANPFGSATQKVRLAASERVKLVWRLDNLENS